MKTQTPLPKHHWRYVDVKILVEDMLKKHGEMTYQQLIWAFQPGTVDEKTLDLVLHELCADNFVDGIQCENRYDDIFVFEQ